MAKLLITRGLPASGKSTWAAKQEGFEVITKDDIRKMFESKGWVWSQKGEQKIIKHQEDTIRFKLKSGQSIIAADTNFGKHEARLKSIADSCGVEFAVRDFTDVPLDVCLERNEKRKGGEGYVPPKAIKDMWAKYVLPQIKPVPVEWDPKLPSAVLVDLDGTMAIHNGRSPYDTASCGTDILNRGVALVVQSLRFSGHEIIFVSGREEQFREQTVSWLKKYGFGAHKLLMRPTGDNRNDAILKNEIFDKNFSGKYNIICCIDDRDRVVKRYREMGLTVLQCNYGDF